MTSSRSMTEQEMLPIMGDVIREDSASRAADAERELERDNVATVCANVRALLTGAGQVPVGHNVVSILGDTLSLAGEPAIRKAWDQLADAGEVHARDTKKRDLWKQVIVRR